MVVTDLDLPEFDYLDPEMRGPRYRETLVALRERGWLATSPLATFVLDREAVHWLLRSRSVTFPSELLMQLFEIGPGALREEIERNILHIDGEQHSRLRSLVNPALTPRAADRFRPDVRRILDGLDIPLDEPFDFIERVAKPFPAQTIAAFMGAPLSDAPRLAEWSNLIQRQFDAQTLMTEREAVERACEEFYAWAGELLVTKRRAPGDDLLSTLIAAEEAGDRLSDVELVNLVLNIFVGGVDTTQSQLAHAVRLFAEHPEQWDLLRARPELVRQAVDEVMRFEPITPFTARLMLEDVEYRHVTFPAGMIVMACIFTANRDGVEEPGRFDIAADRGRVKPLTFGGGIHWCLGSNLARAEMEEALLLLAERVSRFELAGESEYDTISGVYGIKRLPVLLRP